MKLPGVASLLALLATSTGCNSLGIGDHACTEIGCSDGINVHLAALPAGAYTVEILTSGVGDGVSYSYSCAGGTGCRQDIFFPELVLDRIIVRVTTSAGTRLTEIANPQYISSRPNGPDCPPVCRQATVTAELPG